MKPMTAKVLLSLLVAGYFCWAAVGQAAAQGRWTTLPYLMPINPIHMALMNNGQVLIVAGSGYDATVTNFEAAVWDPRTGTISRQPLGWDMFINGTAGLPDGRVLLHGGNPHDSPPRGCRA